MREKRIYIFVTLTFNRQISNSYSCPALYFH